MKNLKSFAGRIGAQSQAPLLASLTVFALVFLLTACSGLGGEPQIVSTIPPATQPPPELGFPESPPDLANGARIFAARCTECHGPNGAGDGELVLNGQVENPGNFRDPASARQQTPKQWYETITNGNIEKLMPPWRDALTEQERWDVALYTYTMHYTPEQIALGEEVFARECVDCHGESGAGDGQEAIDNDLLVSSLNDPERSVEIDDAAMFVFINEGASPDMPAFGQEGLTEEDIWAVVAYSRSLALANTEILREDAPASDVASEVASEVAQASTPEAQAADETVMDITGTVQNRTSGGEVPSGLTIRLRVFDANTFGELPDENRETPLGEDNRFVFEDVTVRADRVYLTAVEYNGRNYASGVSAGTPDAESMNLPIDIYDITSDPADINITALVERISVIGDSIEVQRLTEFTNTSDRVFTETEQQENGLYRSVQMSMPPGAAIVGFDNDAAYTIAEDRMTVYDMRPLIPGESRISVVSYVVQYGGGAIIEYPLDYILSGDVRLLLTPYDTMRAESEQLPSLGEETIGDDIYQSYGNRLALPAGTLLRYELSGEPAPAPAQVDSTDTTGAAPPQVVAPPTVVDADNFPVIVLGVVVIAVLMLGAVFMILNRGTDPQARAREREIDALVAQIAELDAQHDRGEINHDVYRRQREALRARLEDLMSAESKDNV